jgi:uroporphyrinogen decarboxylase
VAGGDVLGVDWRVPIDEAWDRVGHSRAIQGNLDPAVLAAPWETVERKTLEVLRRAGGRDGHVFNLGHGVLPDTPPDTLARLTDLVHSESRDGRTMT